jgi:hypothetical protein
MQDVDPGKCVKGKGDCGREKEAEQSPEIDHPHFPSGPFASLDVHHGPGDEEAKQETDKRDQGLQVDSGQNLHLPAVERIEPTES